MPLPKIMSVKLSTDVAICLIAHVAPVSDVSTPEYVPKFADAM